MRTRADPDRLDAIAEHISATERRAAAAERAAIDRYRATLLAGSIGSLFAARISGVAASGCLSPCPKTAPTGSSRYRPCPAIITIRDERRHRLVGRRSGRVFRLGDEVAVRLVEADGIGGRLVFRIEEANGLCAGSPARPEGPAIKTARDDTARREIEDALVG